MSGPIAAARARWRLGLRLAHRDARRHLGRTILVVLMVTLTVGAGSFVVTALASSEIYGPGDIEAELGPDLQAKIEGVGGEIEQESPNTYGRSAWDGSDPEQTPYTDLERDITAALPHGTTMTRLLREQALVHDDGSAITATVLQTDLQNPAVASRFPIMEGRLPAAEGEVLISRYQFRMGYELGERIHVELADGERVPATIVGVTGLIHEVKEAVPVYFSDPGPLTPPDVVEGRPYPLWYVSGDTPVTWSDVQALNDAGAFVTSRHVLRTMTDDGTSSGGSSFTEVEYLSMEDLWVIAALIIVGILEAVWLIGPAFAIGARQDTRALALLAANGAARSAIRDVVLARAVLAGTIGACFGIGLGMGATLLLIAVAPGTVSALAIPWIALSAIFLIGVAVAVGAAWPAGRRAARADVTTVLSGRRPASSPARIPTVIGAVAALGGIGLAVVAGLNHQTIGISMGIVIADLGLILACGGIVSLFGRLARRAPWTWRFALRDASRQRARTVPAIAAVLVAVAGATAALTTLAGSRAAMLEDYVPIAAPGAVVLSAAPGHVIDDDDERDLDRLKNDVFPEAGPMTPVPIPVTAEGTSIGIYVHNERHMHSQNFHQADFTPPVSDGTDPEFLRALGVPERHHETIRSALAQGRVVAPPQFIFADGTIRVNIATYEQRDDGTIGSDGGPTDVRFPATAIGRPGDIVGNLPVFPESVIDQMGATGTGVGGFIAQTDGSASQAQADLLERRIAAAEFHDGTGSGFSVAVQGPPLPSDDFRIVVLIIAAAALFLALTSTWSAVALSAIDSRPDLRTLAALGATPTARKRVVAAQAGTISVIGTTLGALAGLPLGVGFELNSDLPLTVPWIQIALLAVTVPLLAITAAWLVTRSGVTMSRRRD